MGSVGSRSHPSRDDLRSVLYAPRRANIGASSEPYGALMAGKRHDIGYGNVQTSPDGNTERGRGPGTSRGWYDTFPQRFWESSWEPFAVDGCGRVWTRVDMEAIRSGLCGRLWTPTDTAWRSTDQKVGRSNPPEHATCQASWSAPQS
jgi:hypothetical protein